MFVTRRKQGNKISHVLCDNNGKALYGVCFTDEKSDSFIKQLYVKNKTK